MDNSEDFFQQPVDRTPYAAFFGLAGLVLGLVIVAAWGIGGVIAQVRHVHVSLPHLSAPSVALPTDVGGQVQKTLNDAAGSAAKSAADAATQAAKDEAAKEAQTAQQGLQSSLQNNLK